jgi:site-specific recombinase XerD
LYNTGARVQELVDLNIVDVHAVPAPFVRLTGKGSKQRTCPLWARTVESIARWLALRGMPPENEPLFVNARGERLTRSGVAYILRRAAKRAGLVPQHAPRLTPHIIRHSTAMALVAANVDITSIAAWLGHSQLSTTHAYIEITLRMKALALTQMTAPPEISAGHYPTGDILTWLTDLGSKRGYVAPNSLSLPPTQQKLASVCITRGRT